MATVTEIRERLAAVLAGIEGLTVLQRPPETAPAALPALVIGEPECEFAESDARRGLDVWDFPLLLLVSMGDYGLASQALDSYLTRQGPRSIREPLVNEPSLGLLDGTRAYLTRLDEYGPRESADGRRTAGAVLHLVVRTSG